MFDKQVDVQTIFEWPSSYKGIIGESIGRIAFLQLLDNEELIIDLAWPEIKKDYAGYKRNEVDGIGVQLRRNISHSDSRTHEAFESETWIPDETYTINISRKGWWAVTTDFHLEIKYGSSKVRENQLEVMKQLVRETREHEDTNKVILRCDVIPDVDKQSFNIELYKLEMDGQLIDWQPIGGE